ncbi:hypothetical protein SADUNF_Sadunf08G0161800 [Salix dunnii]|uniref:Uncharacterized protein n=1 Tax=Salix dunnii TaxID=1413687 RepID=A0A835K1T5_9ROSI|nr:hypothetical protein SADUNF_Sadunf08G0161800 [Salix dunnii]
MLDARMLVATFIMAVMCGTDKARYVLEKLGMEVSQIQFNFWIFFSNAHCALALNFSIFLVIGRTGAVTIRILRGYFTYFLFFCTALCGVAMYNYLKVKDVHAFQVPENISDRIVKVNHFNSP